MASTGLSRAGLYAALGFIGLAVVGLVPPSRIAEASAQQAAPGSIKGRDAAGPSRDIQAAPEAAFYYQDEIERTKQRGLDMRQFEQAQDRYYEQQSRDAKLRQEQMNREAEKYYGRP